ncbi:MAG: hypothetical protein ACI4QL_01070 [Candidatus Fimimonas sp.]
MCINPITIPVKRKGAENYSPQTIKCGKCTECLEAKAREWAFRIMDETKFHEQNCFITLTYDNEHLPPGGTLVKADFQKFMKRLRERLAPQKIRFFACGEYGSKTLRPHYHAIIFGWSPVDCRFLKKDSKGQILNVSKLLESVWPYGFSSVGNVTLDSAKYCAKYMQKLQKVPEGLQKPFTLMSLDPGIGYAAIDAKCLSEDKIYNGGNSVPVPRYYLKVLERNGHDLTHFIELRCEVGKIKEQCTDLTARRKKSKEIFKKVLTKRSR